MTVEDGGDFDLSDICCSGNLKESDKQPPVEPNIINLRKKWKGICSGSFQKNYRQVLIKQDFKSFLHYYLIRLQNMRDRMETMLFRKRKMPKDMLLCCKKPYHDI